MQVVIEVTSDRIPQIVAQMQARAIQAVARTVFEIEGSAKMRAPVDTGALRASITGEADGLSGTVSTDRDYAAYQEFGTSRMAAHPYMVPAAEAGMQTFIGEMQQIANG